jgi:hypothetical protein
MVPSAPSPGIGRGSVDSALTLKKQIAGPDVGASHREAPEAAPGTEELEAKWQSAIDAATD